jgi:demethylmenaquinone methyltransferase/2-methoxy-6-polyprenyl-1,4-benzoquinol methylase
MRFLESAPSRYDRGMRWLTLGRVDEIREVVARTATQAATRAGGEDANAPLVLEIGCGTGALTARLLAAGARVTALDQNPQMLELARSRLCEATEACELLERTASEIDHLPKAAFDAVVASFSLSEMSAEERRFVLEQARLRLRSGGRLAVADEVRPSRPFARALFSVLRAPQALFGWLAVGSVSRPIENLEDEIVLAGFRVTHRRYWLGGHLAVIVAEREN